MVRLNEFLCLLLFVPVTTCLHSHYECPLIQGVGVHCVIGQRPAMEDRYYGSAQGGPFYGVYDGHGGDAASDYLKYNLHKVLYNISAAGFLRTDLALFEAIRITDDRFMKLFRASGKSQHGSTCVASYVQAKCQQNGECFNLVHVANLGDSRAIIASDAGKVLLATKDHKPNNPEEKRRIEKNGGFVYMNRVMGNLALSRAIGDQAYKNRKFVIPDSDIYFHKCRVKVTAKDFGCGQYLVLASDGLWDVFSNGEIAKIVAQSGRNVQKTAEDLVKAAIARDSTDNVCVLIVLL